MNGRQSASLERALYIRVHRRFTMVSRFLSLSFSLSLSLSLSLCVCVCVRFFFCIWRAAIRLETMVLPQNCLEHPDSHHHHLRHQYRDRRARISPAPQQLHWLPVKHRVTFKMATLMQVPDLIKKRCPSYLAGLVTSKTHRDVIFNNQNRRRIRRARTQFGKRAFSVCGPQTGPTERL